MRTLTWDAFSQNNFDCWSCPVAVTGTFSVVAPGWDYLFLFFWACFNHSHIQIYKLALIQKTLEYRNEPCVSPCFQQDSWLETKLTLVYPPQCQLGSPSTCIGHTHTHTVPHEAFNGLVLMRVLFRAVIWPRASQTDTSSVFTAPEVTARPRCERACARARHVRFHAADATVYQNHLLLLITPPVTALTLYQHIFNLGYSFIFNQPRRYGSNVDSPSPPQKRVSALRLSSPHLKQVSSAWRSRARLRPRIVDHEINE